jgi:hypothetical protein
MRVYVKCALVCSRRGWRAEERYAAAVEPMLVIPLSRCDMSAAVPLASGSMGLAFKVTLFGTPVCLKVRMICGSVSVHVRMCVRSCCCELVRSCRRKRRHRAWAGATRITLPFAASWRVLDSDSSRLGLGSQGAPLPCMIQVVDDSEGSINQSTRHHSSQL